MIDAGIVQGCAEMAVPVYIGKTLIYVHTDIEKIITDEGAELYQYHEYQYEPDEYLHNVLQDMLNDISRITPHTYTKTAYIGDSEVVFSNVPEGNLSVYIKDSEGNYPSYTVERISDRIRVSFEPVEYVTEVTISII